MGLLTGDIDLNALLLRALEHLLEHDVGNLLDLALGQLAEHDDLVQTVEELGPAGGEARSRGGTASASMHECMRKVLNNRSKEPGGATKQVQVQNTRRLVSKLSARPT